MADLQELREKVLPILLPYVKRVAVFGSFARGEETPGSDIDILVELKDPDDRPPLGLKWFGIEQELERILGRRVDLVSRDALNPHIRERVERDLLGLYSQY